MLEQSFQGYALVAALIFLGFLVVCMPRPRGIAFESEEAEEKHIKRLRNAKAKKKKSRKKKKPAKKKKK
jgi:hypothetical protein